MFSSVMTYKRNSIFYRFWLLIVIGFTIVFLSVMFLVSNYNNTKYYNNIAGMFSKNMYNMRNSLDSVFAEIISKTNEVSVNKKIIDEKECESFNQEYVQDIEQDMKNLIADSEFIKSVYLYYPKSDYVISSSMLYQSGLRSQFADTSWYDTYYGSGSEIFLREYPENTVFLKCISVCRKVSGYDNLIVIYNMNYDKFNIIRKKNVLMDYEISMVNDVGTIIYSTAAEKVGNTVDSYSEMNDSYLMAANNFTVNPKMTKSYLHESVRTKNIRLCIVAEILKKDIDDIGRDKSPTLIMLFVLVLVLLVLSVYLASKFYGSIASISNQLPKDKADAKGDAKTDEVSYINNQILDIVSKKYKTESELAESLMRLQKAQSIALQSQFSPHFLFNTLQMINSIALAEIGGDSDITTAVNLLCNILRVAIDTTEYTCRLRDEIELAKQYIILQNMKYEGVFDVTFDVDGNTEDILVTKLFLQPILENSMHHGFDAKRNHMNIKISARILCNRLVVAIEDDGIGMSEERSREMIENLKNKQIEKKDSIGLLNLNQRIKLIFGQDYGCTIENNGQGVTVTVIFPG